MKNDETDLVVVTSRIWPPTNYASYHHVFEHKDGRKVHYIRGGAYEDATNTRQIVDELIHRRGNIFGLVASAYYWEAFPEEQVCQGCVGEVAFWSEDHEGRVTKALMGRSSPRFSHDYGLGLCSKCAKTEI